MTCLKNQPPVVTMKRPVYSRVRHVLMRIPVFSVSLTYLLFCAYNMWAILVIFLLNSQSSYQECKYDTYMVHLNLFETRIVMSLFSKIGFVWLHLSS